MRTLAIVTAVLGGSLVVTTPALAQRGYGYGYPYGGYGYGPGVGIGFGVGRSGFYPYGGAWYGSGGGYYPGMNPSGGYTYPYISPRFEYGYDSYYPRRGYQAQYGIPSQAYLVIPSTASVPSDRARLQVILPDANAELSFNGTKDPVRGSLRIFEPAPLEPGYKYWYKLEATWLQDGAPVTAVREVDLFAGKLSVVDFTKHTPAPTPMPLPDEGE